MAAARKTDSFPFADFDFTKLNETYRQFAEKGMTQGSQSYEQFKGAAEDATTDAQKSFDAVRDGMSLLAKKAIENTKTNTESGVAFVEKLSTAKSFAEALELQGQFFRATFETLAGQAKEAQELSMKAAEKAGAPAKASVEKAVDRASAQVKSAVDSASHKAI